MESDFQGNKVNTDGWSEAKLKKFQENKAAGKPWLSDGKYAEQSGGKTSGFQGKTNMTGGKFAPSSGGKF
jgi:hypothetical protein